MPEQKRCCANCDNACRQEIWGNVLYTCKLNVGLNATVNPGRCCDDWTGTIPTVDLGLSYDIWT
jgi:hypothetical protein